MDAATIERLCEEALQRIRYFIARSTGQHQRAFREKFERQPQMNEIDDCFSTEESQNEAAAARQVALDLLFDIGCQYGIPNNKMRELCVLTGVSFDDLQKYSGTPAAC